WKSARLVRSMALANDFLAEAPKVDTNVINASPIMRAAAVDAVRLVLRVAFSRASSPVIPRNRADGQPSARAAGPATSGRSMATPTNTRKAASPTIPPEPPGTSDDL